MKFVSLLTFLLIPSFCLAITCDELQSPTQVREFLERSKDSNPILRRNVSTTLEAVSYTHLTLPTIYSV